MYKALPSILLTPNNEEVGSNVAVSDTTESLDGAEPQMDCFKLPFVNLLVVGPQWDHPFNLFQVVTQCVLRECCIFLLDGRPPKALGN